MIISHVSAIPTRVELSSRLLTLFVCALQIVKIVTSVCIEFCKLPMCAGIILSITDKHEPLRIMLS